MAMAVDPRQILAAILTVSMFFMLGNMIKNDHFDSSQLQVPSAASYSNEVRVEKKDVELVSQQIDKGPWNGNSERLLPCWRKPDLNVPEEPKGYITFALTNGPEYHISQVATAVVIARYTGAALVIPEIRGRELGQRRNFHEIYDDNMFVRSLSGIVKVIPELPDVADTEPELVRVPNRLTEDYIMKNIDPLLQTKNHLRLAVYFPSTNMKAKVKDKTEMQSIGCLATFGTLELKHELKEVVDLTVEKLRTLSRTSDGRFIAVDLHVDVLEKKGCKESGKKTCYDAGEIADFLKRAGFKEDATVYLTQTRWHESLDVLKDSFPKTYTKEDILPPEKKQYILHSGDEELEKTLDFYVCSSSDVFVPAISGLFYGNVAGRRIASGMTQILVPSLETDSSASPSRYISSYVSKKTHLAYSCYCRGSSD